MRAELVRVSLHQVDIKIVTDDKQMHVLQWRRNLLWDEVLLDGKRQAHSGGFGREKVYGLVFGRDTEGRGGTKMMLLLDPSANYGNWGSAHQQVSGVRLETTDGPVVAFGTLDPKNLEKPVTFSDWMKKTMGMEWGRYSYRRRRYRKRRYRSHSDHESPNAQSSEDGRPEGTSWH